MISQPVADVHIRWLTPAQGGRTEPPPGPTYAAVAHLASGQENFSVFVRFPDAIPDDQRWNHPAVLTLLATDLLPDIAARIVAGARLILQEGRRPVAVCDVLSVRMDAVRRGA